MSVWRIFSDCPNQPDMPRQLKTHISFSMFPILDTNLWVGVIGKSIWVDMRGGRVKRGKKNADVLCGRPLWPLASILLMTVILIPSGPTNR